MLILIGTALEIISLLSLIPIINSFQDNNQNNKHFEILEVTGSFRIGVFYINIILFFNFFRKPYFSLYIKFQNNVVFDYSNFLATNFMVFT